MSSLSLSFISKVFQSRRLLAVYYFVHSPSLSADGRRRGRYRVPPKRFLCACVQRRPYFPFSSDKKEKKKWWGERTECVRALDANLDVGEARLASPSEELSDVERLCEVVVAAVVDPFSSPLYIFDKHYISFPLYVISCRFFIGER
jgi:hypothetical protein